MHCTKYVSTLYLSILLPHHLLQYSSTIHATTAKSWFVSLYFLTLIISVPDSQSIFSKILIQIEISIKKASSFLCWVLCFILNRNKIICFLIITHIKQELCIIDFSRHRPLNWIPFQDKDIGHYNFLSTVLGVQCAQ